MRQYKKVKLTRLDSPVGSQEDTQLREPPNWSCHLSIMNQHSKYVCAEKEAFCICTHNTLYVRHDLCMHVWEENYVCYTYSLGVHE